MLGPNRNNSDLSRVDGEILTFQESCNILVPQFRCFAISVQRSVQFPNFIVTQSQSR